MDKDEFSAWKDSPATQWVLRRVAQKAADTEAALKDQLFHGTGLTPEEWGVLQSRAAFDRGTVAGMNFVVALELTEITDDAEQERN